MVLKRKGGKLRQKNVTIKKEKNGQRGDNKIAVLSNLKTLNCRYHHHYRCRFLQPKVVDSYLPKRCSIANVIVRSRQEKTQAA